MPDDTQAEIAKLKKVLEMVMLENQALKAKIVVTSGASMLLSPGIPNKEVSASTNWLVTVETYFGTSTKTEQELMVPNDSTSLAKRSPNRKRTAAQTENTEFVTVA